MTFVVITLLSTFSGLTQCVAENYEAKKIPCPWGTASSFPSNSCLVHSDLPGQPRPPTRTADRAAAHKLPGVEGQCVSSRLRLGEDFPLCIIHYNTKSMDSIQKNCYFLNSKLNNLLCQV